MAQGDSVDRETLIAGCDAISGGQQRVANFIRDPGNECFHEYDSWSR